MIVTAVLYSSDSYHEALRRKQVHVDMITWLLSCPCLVLQLHPCYNHTRSALPKFPSRPWTPHVSLSIHFYTSTLLQVTVSISPCSDKTVHFLKSLSSQMSNPKVMSQCYKCLAFFISFFSARFYLFLGIICGFVDLTSFPCFYQTRGFFTFYFLAFYTILYSTKTFHVSLEVFSDF